MTREAALQALLIRRQLIDQVDLRILALLNERAQIVEQIGHIKQSAELPIYEPRREDQVFRNVTDNNLGPLGSDAVKRVFERIIDEMRKVQSDRMEADKKQTGN
ncbi:MAG TPA: chorismate mutase [Bryobacteraceae bacterium]|jgi:chorismate mutase-like protein